MKKITFLFVFLPLLSIGQSYVDVLKIGYGNAFNSEFDGTIDNTDVKDLDVSFTYPVPLSEKQVLITGIDYSRTALQLAPGAKETELSSTTLKIGLASTFSEKWSSTVVFLPKIASDYSEISGDDFYLGAFAILKLKKNENFTYKFGLYASSEAFGLFATPIIGAYYISPNQRLEVNASLPISANINYTMGKIAIGLDYLALGRSYVLREFNNPTVYVEQTPITVAPFVQLNAFQNSILFRAKFGYSTNNHEVYKDGDDLDFKISAFEVGDEREQLNPSLNGGLFLKLEVVYRFHIKKKESRAPETD